MGGAEDGDGVETIKIHCVCQIQRKLHFPKFWSLDKKRHSPGLVRQFPSTKGAVPLRQKRRVAICGAC